MFERKKYLIQEIEELKGFLKNSDQKYKDLESKYNDLVKENQKLRKILSDIEEVVSPIVTRTVTVSSGKISFGNINAGVAK